MTVQYVLKKEWICIDSNNEEVYLLPDNRTLYIRPEAIEKMFKYKQEKKEALKNRGLMLA
jgi:hypothetical protein